jgi:hypothetical protein
MDFWLIIAAVLVVSIGAAHSILGERYILIRLFSREDLPQLFGSDVFTKQTLRFAWHLTTVAWIGLAAILSLCAAQDWEMNRATIVGVIRITFLISTLLSLVITRGRHLSWVVFLAIAAATWLGSQY